MMIKYPIHKVAKDFKHGSKELPSKEVMDILTQYGHPPKNHMQPLTEQELSIVFEYLTQHNQVESIASIYEDVYHEPAKPAAQQAKQAPAAHQKGGASKQPAHSQQPAAPKGGKQAPVQQQARAGGKPQQHSGQIHPHGPAPMADGPPAAAQTHHQRQQHIQPQLGQPDQIFQRFIPALHRPAPLCVRFPARSVFSPGRDVKH